MVTGDFDTVINDLLEDNGAVDSYSIQNETASVIVHSRAGRTAKDSVLVEPILNDLDASYHGCSNGWER
ncbi:MAG: hypothetical protein SVU32_01525, partial [Candidatus Nanohaloarchaea archaeon]|nr:hypothetical protein [Candidatus Nanohaloarchaea archaeon]